MTMTSLRHLLRAAIIGIAALGTARPPQTVTIIGNDYAFQIPPHILAGETAIGFENHGTVRHELSIALLREGTNADSILQGLAAGLRRRDFIEGQAALIVARPGELPGPRLLFDLQRGRTYLVLCTLMDAPGQPPHVTMGMLGRFTAE
jgi:hypothetical protein